MNSISILKAALQPFFLSVFRKNLDNQGRARGDALDGIPAAYMRGKVTTEIVAQILDYYKN